MTDVGYSVHLAVVGYGRGAERWRHLLEAELARTQHLAATPAVAGAVVVVIGPSFCEGTTADRDAPNTAQADCFAAIRAALVKGSVLLPVTVRGAQPLRARSLPKKIRRLAKFQAMELVHDSDVPGVVARLVLAAESAGHRYVPAERPAHRVFISYRRDDCWYWARLLATALTERIGAPNVFWDIGSIAPGRRFAKEILRRVRESTDVVILVGPSFLARGETGGRRIDDPHDFLHREIATAIGGLMESRARIHVVLTVGASLPDASQLPADVAPAFGSAAPLHLDSHEAVGSLADAIVGRRRRPAPWAHQVADQESSRIHGYLRTHGYLSPQQKIDRLITVAGPRLAEFGWQPVDLAKSKGVLAMARPDAEMFRFTFDFERFDLVLMERARSRGSLGLLHWIERARFPFGLDETDTAVVTPPAALVEAMADPGAYLDRVGRFDLESLPSPPKGLLSRAKSELRAASQPGPTALTQHARERQVIRQRGGLAQLERITTVSLDDTVKARAVAFNPAINQFVVASSDGLYAVDPNDGAAQRLRCHGHHDLLTVAVSRGGRIAATDYNNRITVLDRDGTELVRSKTPYSLWQRRRWHAHFASPSWHEDETRLALGGSDRVWIYDVAIKRFGQVPLQDEESWMSAGAPALFVPGSDDLLVVQRRKIWRVSTATQELLRQLDTSTGSDIYPPHRDDSFPFSSPLGFFPHCIALSADARGLALGGNDAQLVLLDNRTLRPLTLRVWHLPLVTAEKNGQIEALAYSPDGAKLASVANDDRLVIGDAQRGDPLAEGNLSQELPEPYLYSERRVCWSADGARIAVANGERRIEIFDVQA